MTLPTVALASRPVAAALPCLFLALIGCGRLSSSSHTAGTGGTHDGSAGEGDSGGNTSGGSAGGTRGGSAGTGGVNVGAVAGVSGMVTGGVDHSGGIGGDAAMAGAAGMAGAGGATAGSCVNVSGAGDKPWYNLTIVGSQFDADEGARMRIVVATQSSNRVGVGDVTIVGGAFTLSMPQVLNASWYVGVTAYIDKNDNDTCEPDEPVWEWTTSAVASDIQYEVTPGKLCSSTLGSCTTRHPMQPVCWVGSGDTVLTKALPCKP